MYAEQLPESHCRSVGGSDAYIFPCRSDPRTRIKRIQSKLHFQLVFSLLQEIFSTVYYNKTLNVTVYECEVSVVREVEFAVYRLVIVFAVPALLMCFFYARVIKALWICTKAMTAMTRVYR